jgi:hypothetical protein
VLARTLAALDDPSARDHAEALMPVLVEELGPEHRYTRELAALHDDL